jgi:hypothetical protein
LIRIRSSPGGMGGIHGSGKLYPRHLYFATVACKCGIYIVLSDALTVVVIIGLTYCGELTSQKVSVDIWIDCKLLNRDHFLRSKTSFITAIEHFRTSVLIYSTYIEDEGLFS